MFICNWNSRDFYTKLDWINKLRTVAISDHTYLARLPGILCYQKRYQYLPLAVLSQAILSIEPIKSFSMIY